MLEGVENGLYLTKKLHRQSLKVSIDVSFDDVGDLQTSTDFKTVLKQIDRILLYSQASQIDDYMLCLRWYDAEEAETVLDLIKEHTTFPIIAQDDLVVITNNDCKICGYGESWLM